jgi:hypothetical protein
MIIAHSGGEKDVYSEKVRVFGGKIWKQACIDDGVNKRWSASPWEKNVEMKGLSLLAVTEDHIAWENLSDVNHFHSIMSWNGSTKNVSLWLKIKEDAPIAEHNIKIGDKFLQKSGDVMYIKDFYSPWQPILEHSKHPKENILPSSLTFSKIKEHIANKKWIKLPQSFKGFNLENFQLDSVLWDNKLEILWKITEVQTGEFLVLRLQKYDYLKQIILETRISHSLNISLNSKTIARFRSLRDSQSIISKMYERCPEVLINKIAPYLHEMDIYTVALFSHFTTQDLRKSEMYRSTCMSDLERIFKVPVSGDVLIFKAGTYKFTMNNFQFTNFKLTPQGTENVPMTLTKKEKSNKTICLISSTLSTTRSIYFRNKMYFRLGSTSFGRST